MSNTVLHIDASARSAQSVSRQNSAKLVASLNPNKVITRDLSDGLPFLNEDWVTATFMPPADRNDTQAQSLSLSDTLVAELQEADTIVIGAPIYNFHVPAVLKAWIDQIARAGVTFKYTENGPQGLLEGKKVIITLASGGVPIGSEMDFASPYLKAVLAFVGLTDVTILNSEEAESFAEAA